MGAGSMQALPPKKEVALALLQRSSMFIHLDPRSDAVRVPPWFKKQAQLVLQVGLNMAVPIRDLEVDDEAISCTLSFSRSPHFCWMPFSAIYALVGEDGRGMVWPDDVPPEVAAQANGKGSQQESPRKRSHLRAVSDDEQAEAAADSDAAPAAEAPAPGADLAPGKVPASPDDRAPKRAGLRSVPPAAPKPAGVKLAAVKPTPESAPAAQAGDTSSAAAASAEAKPGAAKDSMAGGAAGAEPGTADSLAAASTGSTATPVEPDNPDADHAEAPMEPDDGKRKLPPYLRIVK